MEQKPKLSTEEVKNLIAQVQARREEARALRSRDADEVEIDRVERRAQGPFNDLMNQYHKSVYYLIYKMVRNPHDSEDLTQEAFMKAYASITSYDDRYAFSTWLFKIATNNAIDFIRKKNKQDKKTVSINAPTGGGDENFAPIDIPDAGASPSDAYQKNLRRDYLKRNVDQLPDDLRELVSLRYQQEYSYEEISQQLDVPLGTVKAKLHRARKKLFQALENDVHAKEYLSDAQMFKIQLNKHKDALKKYLRQDLWKLVEAGFVKEQAPDDIGAAHRYSSEYVQYFLQRMRLDLREIFLDVERRAIKSENALAERLRALNEAVGEDAYFRYCLDDYGELLQSRLPEQKWKLVSYGFIEELSPEEIGSRMALTPALTAQRINRYRQRLELFFASLSEPDAPEPGLRQLIQDLNEVA